MLAFVDRRRQYPAALGLGFLFARPELPVGVYERVLDNSRLYGELPVPISPDGGRNSAWVLSYSSYRSFICNKVPGDNQVCIRTVTSTSYTGLKCSGSIYNQLTVYTVPATATDAQITVSSHILSAQLIQLNWQSSDRASFPTSRPTVSMNTSTTSPSMPTRGGLTAGEKAGIGIGTSLGAIGLGISIWYLVRRFQKQREASSAQIDRSHVREVGGKQIYEVPDPLAPVWELPGHQPWPR
ncbi:hypothetical protein F4782DRAFT_90383 [Xylaria castorea]|nr:hypothetical protein F4782DRAFT_90383 [Xylaria castorea]